MAEFFGQVVDSHETATTTKALPLMERRTKPKFLLMCHPTKWTWSAHAQEWLPRLSRLRLRPGSAGIGLAPDGKTLIIGPAIQQYTSRGWLIIQNHDPRLAEVVDKGAYLKKWRAAGGYAYTAVWEVPTDDSGELEWETDIELLTAVQRKLKHDVLNGEPADRYKRVQIRQQKRRVARIQENSEMRPDLPGLVTKLDRAYGLLKDWESDLQSGGPLKAAAAKKKAAAAKKVAAKEAQADV